MAEITIYCTDLEAPEPVNKVLDTLEDLDQNSYIKMVHRIEPRMLFGILKLRGFDYEVRKNGDVYHIYIWHKTIHKESLFSSV